MIKKLPFYLSVCLFTSGLFAQAPEENRFQKVVLAEDLNEPLELAVLPDERVLFIERHGLLKLFDPATGQTTVAAEIPVSTKYNPGPDGVQAEAEDGLLGLSIDPDFQKNHWVYLYYSPAGDEPKNILTRYTLHGKSLDISSLKIILEIPTQRDQCCHTGGSISWDASGNLFLSTGDNTSPRESDGYAPIDERPGRSAFDAQKSSSNTNDLRGKILRIHPEPDGTYSIPKGNLFPPGTALTRPEIYTMGHRNPYRISVDEKTGFLYWGDVGPDAGTSTEGRGPTAEDEFNQARNAGNFGWPYFVGNNKPFWDFDFETGQSGSKFDPAKPINNSPNNTGLNELPAAQKAMIFYTAGESIRFPLLGTGGRSAMAGPVYRKESFKNASRAFPDYYDGKWFIYEWMRDWILAVSLNEEGNYIGMERFLPNLKLEHPIDMAFGPNGDLYLLEYGQGWFMANPESKLVKIEYNGGNRKPLVKAAADKSVGAIPLSVRFSSEGTLDYDQDSLTYEWKIKDTKGKTLVTLKEANPKFEFKKAGEYPVELTVTDATGQTATAELTIRAGNEPPRISINLSGGNQSFFFPGKKIAYEVSVSDKEDGSLADGRISAAQVKVTAGFQDMAPSSVQEEGHQQAPATFLSGKLLLDQNDCKACHMAEKKSVGPSYTDIALKYKSTPAAVSLLAEKVIKGGAGVWGDVAMSAHPALSMQEATQMTQYILSMAETTTETPSLPVRGEINPIIPEGVNPALGVYTFTASYTDKGLKNLAPITTEKTLTLRNPTLLFGNAEEASSNIMKFKTGATNLMIVMSPNTFASYKSIDLTGVSNMTLLVAAPVEQLNSQGGVIEIRLGKEDGRLIGQTPFIEPSSDPNVLTGASLPPAWPVPVEPVTGIHDIYFVFKNDRSKGALFIPVSVTFGAE